MSRAPLSYVTAYLQFAVAIMFVLGYFGFMFMLFSGLANIRPDLIELGKTLAVGLSSALGLLMAFLYLRSRVDGVMDSGNASITQTTVAKTPATPAPSTGEPS